MMTTPETGSIAGTVLGSAGQPVSCAGILAAGASMQEVKQSMSDTHGAYRLTGLVPGEYSVSVFPPPGFVVPKPVPAAVKAYAETPLDIHLGTGGIVTGPTGATGPMGATGPPGLTGRHRNLLVQLAASARQVPPVQRDLPALRGPATQRGGRRRHWAEQWPYPLHWQYRSYGRCHRCGRRRPE